MKPGALSRGGIVNEVDLLEAQKNNRWSRYRRFENEPYDGPLISQKAALLLVIWAL